MSPTDEPNRVLQMTPPGEAAVAVIRVIGPAVPRFLATHFAKPTPIGRCVHVDLRDSAGIVLDDLVVVTGEGWGDLCCHGGVWLTEAVVRLAEQAGFARAHATSITDGFPEAGDWLTREMLAAVPNARTAEALRLLLAQPACWARVRERLAAGDEAAVRSAAAAALEDASLVTHLRLPRVAIVGPANAGKSTLANRLFGQARSIVADQPGTTRDWVGGIADLAGLAVLLIDTPGARQDADALERQAMTLAAPQVAAADLVLFVQDARDTDSAPPPRIGCAVPSLRVWNKIDLAGERPRGPAELLVSAATGAGLDLLISAVRASLRCPRALAAEARCWTERQRAVLSRVAENTLAVTEMWADGGRSAAGDDSPWPLA